MPLVSPPVQISVPLEKVLLLRRSRALFPTSHSYREPEVDPEQFQDPENEYERSAGTTYGADVEEADEVDEQVDKNMDARRRARRFANTFDVTLFLVFTDLFTAKSGIKIPYRATEATRQFVDFKRGLVGRLNNRCVALNFHLACVYADRES